MFMKQGEQLTRVDSAREDTLVRHGDLAGLFGNDHGERVGLVADAQRGSVSCAKVGVDSHLSAQGKKAGGCGDSVSAENDRAIVQRSAGREDVDQKVARDLGVEADATVGIVAQALPSFEDENRSDSSLDQLGRGAAYLANGRLEVLPAS